MDTAKEAARRKVEIITKHLREAAKADAIEEALGNAKEERLSEAKAKADARRAEIVAKAEAKAKALEDKTKFEKCTKMQDNYKEEEGFCIAS